MMEAGFRPSINHIRYVEDIHAFIEIHIEQGPVLEKLQKSIGIVETIVGQKRFRVTVEGEPESCRHNIDEMETRTLFAGLYP